MINFPEIDLKDRNILILIFIFSVVLLFFQYFETNFLLGLLIFLYLITEYPNIQKNVKNNILKEKKDELLNYKFNPLYTNEFDYSMNYTLRCLPTTSEATYEEATGSAILAISNGKEMTIAYEMMEAASKAGIKGDTLITKPCSNGAKIDIL